MEQELSFGKNLNLRYLNNLTQIVGIFTVLLSVMVFFLLVATTQTLALTWKIESVDSSSNTGAYTSLILDSNDVPHISYHSHEKCNLMYATRGIKEWIHESPDLPVLETSIILDDEGNPHISYYHWDKKHLYYTTQKENRWILSPIDTEGDIGRSSHILFDKNKHLRIYYYDVTNGDLKMAKQLSDGNWSIEKIIHLGLNSAYVSFQLSVKLDGNDNAHISCFDGKSKSLLYFSQSKELWAVETVDNSGDCGQFSNLVLDKNDNPHISYYDKINGLIKFASRTGSSWKIQFIDESPVMSSYTSLTMDKTGKPHLVYMVWIPEALSGCLKYATLTGGKWTSEIIDNSGNVGWFASLSLDRNQNPHTAYYDGTNNRLSYATGNP